MITLATPFILNGWDLLIILAIILMWAFPIWMIVRFVKRQSKVGSKKRQTHSLPPPIPGTRLP